MSKKPLDYEKAREELSEIVRQLESGEVSLTDSMKLWQRGEALAKQCQEFLAGAAEKLQTDSDE